MGFEIGDVVYFVEKRIVDSKIEYGMITWINGKTYGISRIKFRDTRIINGIPIQDFEITDWMPTTKEFRKGARNLWDLVNIETRYCVNTEKLAGLTLKEPNDIKKLIELGVMVRCIDEPDWDIDVEPKNRDYKEYRIKKSIPAWISTYGNPPDTISLYETELLATYDEAEKAKQEWETELEIERNLSDYDWSVKEMDKVLKMFHDDDFAEKCMAKLLSMDKVEDIEIKKSDDKVLWRYFMTPLDDGYKDNKWKILEV